MCGIAGIWSCDANRDDLERDAARMTATLEHRGPDDCNLWCDPALGVALGHRRLSIVDLSESGRQPMHSASGRYAIAYNGEIYNHAQLRNELAGTLSGGPAYRGHSDTEVLLAAVEHWGLRETLKRTVGMFAFALWDRCACTLTLARDRMGEKPLYYGWLGATFVFASELKALAAHPAWRGDVNRDALALMMRYCYVPAPYSIFENVFKVQPGVMLTVDSRASGETREEPYWLAKQVFEAGGAEPFAGCEQDAVDRVDRLLTEAVQRQMVADVPVGAFLSGGIDSSLIVALMRKCSTQPVRTFTIGFHERQFNEAEAAKAVARQLGTQHTELYVTAHDALGVVERLPEIFDEPFADPSQIPTYLLARLTAEHVKVSLSGDGADELFGGYDRYFSVERVWRRMAWMPRGVRQAAVPVVRLASRWAGSWGNMFPPGSFVSRRAARLTRRIGKWADWLPLRSREELLRAYAARWQSPTALVLNSTEPPHALVDRSRWAKLDDAMQRILFLDTVSYLPDDILVKVDRASMAVSLESRAPFLDHRVVEFAARLPTGLRMRPGCGKWVLRKVLDRYVPRALVDRPKQGFSVAIGDWLRGPLREWAESLLDVHRLRREGFLDVQLVRSRWESHVSGQTDWYQNELWNVLMFQQWHERWQRRDDARPLDLLAMVNQSS